MFSSSKFVTRFRQKPLQKNEKTICEKPPEEKEKEKELTTSSSTRYVGIENADLEQRVQHTIRNLLELDEEELKYISEMNCKRMFEIVKLLNRVVSTLVENITALN